MAKPKTEGTCHLCGAVGPLTAEHVPPQKAFNDRKMYIGKPANGLPFGPGEMIDRRTVQGGVRFFTLCGDCNNRTGGWYGPAFVYWCWKGMNALTRGNGKPNEIYCDRAFPLLILKQIATMFFSLVNEDFRKHQPELVRFILNKEERDLPPHIRFLTYFSAGDTNDRLRYVEPFATINTETGRSSIFSEIVFPPFGYIMLLDNSELPDKQLRDITFFSRYRYDKEVELTLQMPVFATHLRLGGDYRQIG